MEYYTHDSYIDGPDYDIGLSPLIRERLKPSLMCELITRTLANDPGDSDDIENIMQTVSASMDEAPSIRQFDLDGHSSSVLIMFKPKDLIMFIVYREELSDENVVGFSKGFGFDPTAMRALNT